jgi:hypothetical protein
MGAKVFSTECVQSHYVYQSNFYDFCQKNNFTELAFFPDLLSENKFSLLNHLPWWKICHPKANLPKADVVVSNHMLMETSSAACDFYRHFANKILKDNGSWIIEGFGAHYIGGPTQQDFIKSIIEMNLFFLDLTSIYSHYGVYLVSKSKRNHIVKISSDISLQNFINESIINFPPLIDDEFLTNSLWMDFLQINPNLGSRLL